MIKTLKTRLNNLSVFFICLQGIQGRNQGMDIKSLTPPGPWGWRWKVLRYSYDNGNHKVRRRAGMGRS